MNKILSISIAVLFALALAGFYFYYTPNQKPGAEEAPGPVPTSATVEGVDMRALEESGLANNYVSENIRTLSPEPEVLGGTFYVTSIQSGSGTGVVSYEDGHNAYTADFAYTIDASKAVTITSFTIRPE